MLATLLKIWELIKIIWGFINTVIGLAKIAVHFTFGLFHSVLQFLIAIFTGHMVWLFPLGGLSLGIGWLLLVLRRR